MYLIPPPKINGNALYLFLDSSYNTADDKNGQLPIFLFCGTDMNIEKIIDNTLSGLGYECVDIEKTPHGILRIFIDKPEGISIDDCVYVTSQLNRILTVEEVDYKTLEVSSPGLDRVLKKPVDFLRFVDYLANIKTRLPINGQKKFTGRIIGFKQDTNTLTLFCETQNANINIEFNNIEKARLKPEI